MAHMNGATRAVSVVRVQEGRTERDVDAAAAEEPLEVRLHGEPFAVIMRTPGDDEALTIGFLLSEQMVGTAADASLSRPCAADGAPLPNAIDVALRDPGRVPAAADRRRVVMNASCGLCGRVSIDTLRADAPPITAAWTVSPALIERMPVALRAAQSVFDETGGLHAAGLFEKDGTLVAIAEDVGRHNAVDKAIGGLLPRRPLPFDDLLLFVSGRSSYEIVQKAFLAGVPLVAAVSAPSSLAVDLARDAGMTLLGFVRGSKFNVYSRPDRVRL
jgi:FdhD protein